MAADSTVVTKRATEAINACAAGTFATTIDSNYLDRNATAITETVTEAALDIARAIVQNPDHPHRNLFVSSSPTTLTHAGEVPDYATDQDLVEIQQVSAGSWFPGVKLDAATIQHYRENPSNAYDSVAHTAAGSILTGFYEIYKGRSYFTGFAARMYPPAISRATVTSLIPDEYEGTWVKLTIGGLVKEGDNLFPIAQYFMNLGMSDLNDIARSNIHIPPMPDPRDIKWAEVLSK